MDFDTNYAPVPGWRARDYLTGLLVALLPAWCDEYLEMLRFRKRFLKTMGVSKAEFRGMKRLMIGKNQRYLTMRGTR